MKTRSFFLCLACCVCFGISGSAQFRLFNSNKVIRAHVTPATRLIEMPEEFSRNFLSDYSDHVCWIKNPKTQLWGLLDTAGNMLIEPIYSLFFTPKFSDGVCFLPYSADTAGLRSYLQSAQISLKPSSKKSASKGKTSVGKLPALPPLRGYFSIDRNGKILGYYPQFDDISSFTNGLASTNLAVPAKRGKSVKNEPWFAYINTKGEIQFPQLKQPLGNGIAYTSRNLQSGLRAHFDYKKQKWGYINAKGTWAIPAQFDEVRDFSCRRAIVRIDELWGFINPQGKLVISPRYVNEPYDFSESYAVIFKSDVAFEERTAIIDTMGNIVLDKLEDALPFYQGVCFANGKLGKYSSGKTYLLDKNLAVIKSIKRIVWGHGNNSESYPYFTQQLNTLLLGQEALSNHGDKVYESTEKLRPFYCGRSKVFTTFNDSDTTRYWGFMNVSGEVAFLILPKPKY